MCIFIFFQIVPSYVKPIFIRLSRLFGRFMKVYGVEKYLDALSPMLIEMMTYFTDSGAR